MSIETCDIKTLGVVGSRDWPSPSFVYGVLDAFYRRNPEIKTVVSGGHWEGVDHFAEKWSSKNDLEFEKEIPDHWRDEDDPEWSEYDPSNYHERNHRIALRSDFLLAFQWEGSKGTASAISKAEDEGTPHLVLDEEDYQSI